MAEKVIPIERPTCGVNGFFPPKAGQKYGAMCGQIGAGGTKLCHYEGKCEHQRPQEAKQGGADHG